MKRPLKNPSSNNNFSKKRFKEHKNIIYAYKETDTRYFDVKCINKSPYLYVKKYTGNSRKTSNRLDVLLVIE